MAIGRTLTKHLNIEARQHEILGLDLGEGPKRSTMLIGLVAFVLWGVIALALTGPPTPDTLVVYMFPPAFIVGYGIQENPANPRRTRLTAWMLRLRYILTGHRPLIALGARTATRKETLPLGYRVRPATVTDTDPHGQPSTEPVIRMNQATRLYGNAHLAAVLEKKARQR